MVVTSRSFRLLNLQKRCYYVKHRAQLPRGQSKLPEGGEGFEGGTTIPAKKGGATDTLLVANKDASGFENVPRISNRKSPRGGGVRAFSSTAAAASTIIETEHAVVHGLKTGIKVEDEIERNCGEEVAAKGTFVGSSREILADKERKRASRDEQIRRNQAIVKCQTGAELEKVTFGDGGWNSDTRFDAHSSPAASDPARQHCNKSSGSERKSGISDDKNDRFILSRSGMTTARGSERATRPTPELRFPELSDNISLVNLVTSLHRLAKMRKASSRGVDVEERRRRLHAHDLLVARLLTGIRVRLDAEGATEPRTFSNLVWAMAKLGSRIDASEVSDGSPKNVGKPGNAKSTTTATTATRSSSVSPSSSLLLETEILKFAISDLRQNLRSYEAQHLANLFWGFGTMDGWKHLGSGKRDQI